MGKKKFKKPLDLLLFFVLGVGVGIAFGMSAVLLIRQSGEKEEEEIYKYEIVPLTNCDDEPKLYYQEQDRNIYLYCLNSVKVNDGNNVLELKNYLQKHPSELEEMKKQMIEVAYFKDGGSILYQDESKLSKNGFSVLNCSTLDGSKDVYIGPKNMDYKRGFCQVEEKELIRTYHVINVEPSNDANYLQITIQMFQREEVETVTVPVYLASIIQVGKNYEFTFHYTQSFEDTIPSIFYNATLIDIKETDKIGFQQIQGTIE